MFVENYRRADTSSSYSQPRVSHKFSKAIQHMIASGRSSSLMQAIHRKFKHSTSTALLPRLILLCTPNCLKHDHFPFLICQSNTFLSCTSSTTTLYNNTIRAHASVGSSKGRTNVVRRLLTTFSAKRGWCLCSQKVSVRRVK